MSKNHSQLQHPDWEALLALALDLTHAKAFVLHIKRNTLEYPLIARECGMGDPQAIVPFENFFRTLHPDDREILRGCCDKALSGESQLYSCQYRVIETDGTIRWMHDIGKVAFAADGSPETLSGISKDITGRKRAEEGLRESERRLAMALDAGQLGCWDWDIRSGAVLFGGRWATMLGRELDEIEPRIETWEYLLHPEDLEQTMTILNAHLEGKIPRYECVSRLRHKDGSWRWILSRGQVVSRDSAGKALRAIGTHTDITEQRMAEQCLREREQLLQVVTDATPALIAYIDRDLRYRFANRQYELWFKLPREKVLGRTMGEVLGEGVLAFLRPYVDRALQGERVHFETKAPYQNGEHRWIDGQYVPDRNQQGDVIGFFVLVLDITERKAVEEELRLHREHLEELVQKRTAELEASHHRIRVSERMAAIGTLAAGLGHDMGNLLMPLRVRLDTLDSLDLTDDARTELKGVRTTVDYLRKLASGLRLLSMENVNPSEPTELSTWWTETEAVFRNVLPSGIRLIADFESPAECWVSMAKPALTQAVFNLIQNAGDAMKGRGDGMVIVRSRREGNQMRLSVSDNGPGMDEAVRIRCMEPFFTTKTRGISTGLGLALVYGLTREARGHVEIESTPGHGSTFTLILEIFDVRARPRPPPMRAAVEVHNARLRAYTTAELQKAGFELLSDASRAAPADIVIHDGTPPPGIQARLFALPKGSKVSDIRHIIIQATKL